MKKRLSPQANLSSLLVVTDFADASLQGLLWAIPEAQRRNLEISVLYPYRLEPGRQAENLPLSIKELDREATKKFELLAQGLLLSSGIPFDFRSEVGFLRDRIAAFAKKHEVEMVVIDSQMAGMESFPELLVDLKIPLVIVPLLALV